MNSKFIKGQIPWNKGLKRTDKEKHNISLAVKNAHKNPEYRKKLSIAQKKLAKNRIHPMLGRKHTEESKKLMSINRTGKLAKENHPSWKGGISKDMDKKRKNSEYRYWRKKCLERENFTCQISGQFGGRLVVHHINNFSEFPELRYEISNGFVMTEELHLKFHSMYGVHNNTREQLEEFINKL